MSFRIQCIGLLLVCVLGCQTTSTYQTIQGQTWTSYMVKVNCPKSRVFSIQRSIDSLLTAIDLSVSTYIDSSTISRYNQDNTYFFSAMEDVHFRSNHTMATEVFKQSNGSFDPTVKPLVDYYGFGIQQEQLQIDSTIIDSIMTHVGFGLRKNTSNVNPISSQLDFSAIAKGYMVDQVGRLLESKGYENYLVEIGGEVKAKGVNHKRNLWSLGIEQPLENSNQGSGLNSIIPLSNQSMATSGNYRNFKIIDGQKVVHTINPKTGYPEISNLLSATIITDDCAYADAYATACMVMGLATSQKWIESMPGVEGYFIYSNDKGEFESYASSGIKNKIILAK